MATIFNLESKFGNSTTVISSQKKASKSNFWDDEHYTNSINTPKNALIKSPLSQQAVDLMGNRIAPKK
jgi:hypothetical protein